jgi:peptidoglycan-N-acetylglucosamine deacetylase
MTALAWVKRYLPAPAYSFVRDAGLGALGSIVGADVGEMPVVALTFDDGPGPATHSILEGLARGGARATFFLLGKNAKAHPDAGRAIVRAGHEVGNHTFSHRALPSLAAAARDEDIRAGRDAIHAVTGVETRLLRPPYGFQNLRSYIAARRAGYTVVGWSLNTDDWAGGAAETIAARVTEKVQPGDIVLLHDAATDFAGTVGAVTLVLEAFRARGLRCVTVSELLAAGRARKKLWFRSGPAGDVATA